MNATEGQLAMVRKAVEMLDKYAPFGWREEIDLDSLNLGSVRFCILGQIYGNYDDYDAQGFRDDHESEWDELSYAFNSRVYEDAWKQILGEKSTDPMGMWYGKNNDALTSVEVISVFKDGEVDFVVYKTDSGFKYIRSLARLRDEYQQEQPKPKYVEGGLYSPARFSGDVVLVFTDPGFVQLGKYSSWSGSTEHFEERFGELVPVELVGLNVRSEVRLKQAMVQL